MTPTTISPNEESHLCLSWTEEKDENGQNGGIPLTFDVEFDGAVILPLDLASDPMEEVLDEESIFASPGQEEGDGDGQDGGTSSIFDV